jgi:hypothetical protein
MESRNLRIVVHGDDFTVLGHARELDWFRQKIKERYEVKFRARIGPEIKDDKSVRILNRIVTWNEDGIEYESDQRHAEIIVNELGLKPDNVKSVVTPGVKETAKEELDNEEFNSHESTKYRQLVARASYLAQDRSDIGYAVKELTRWMSKPGTKDWESLKRLGRYLKGKERMIIKFEYQQWNKRIQVWSDTDYAGCHRTRKSTNGGIVRIGNHAIKSYSTTQPVIALSSGEAEYYGLVKGGSLGLGIKSLAGDLGIIVGIDLMTDSTAAQGIASRKGLGRVRHIEVNQLWIQDKVSTKQIVLIKVKGTENLADALTKYIDSKEIEWHIEHMYMHACDGRHQLAPQLNDGQMDEQNMNNHDEVHESDVDNMTHMQYQ